MPDTTDAVMDLAKRRGFLWPSFEVYGGAAGLVDYGPLGAAMKERFEALWRHVMRTSAVASAEVACPRVTIEDVLTASGHVAEFTDLVVRCGQGHPQRADHLVEAAGYEGTADALDAETIDAEIASRGPKCPVCGNKKWSPAAPLNLMFETEIGPGSGRVGYMRPETAQGIFTDFPHLLRFFRGKLPFAALQVGGSNRNEISPRQGMLRLREFHMMEAEVFFADTDAPLPGFDAVADERATFVPNATEAPISRTFREAVDEGLVANQALAYFMARTQHFLLLAGLDPERVRFRQHLADEMAHYANDCWDAEFHSDRYGWVECVGVADRGCYDLMMHAKHSGKWGDFTVRVPLASPIRLERIVPVMKEMGKAFKGEAKAMAAKMEAANLAAAAAAGLPLDMDPEGLSLDDVIGQTRALDEPAAPPSELDGIPLPEGSVTVEVLEILEGRRIPRVIEPSFGVDRILYAIWEHAYERGEKNGEPYTRMRLSPHVAPIQAAVLPLTGQPLHTSVAGEVEATLRAAGLRTDMDASGNIGRRYARQDEIGTPYCITVDDETAEDRAVTVRDRDTTEQTRVPIEGLVVHMARRFAL